MKLLNGRNLLKIHFINSCEVILIYAELCFLLFIKNEVHLYLDLYYFDLYSKTKISKLLLGSDTCVNIWT